MSGLWHALTGAVGAIFAMQCRVLSASAQYLAEAMERFQPDTAEATGAKDRAVAQVVEWLSAPERSALRNEVLLKLVPVVFSAIEESGLRGFIGERVRLQLEDVDLAPAATGLLSVAIEKGYHQRLLDELLDGLEKVLGNEEAMEGLRMRARGQLPAIFDLYRGEPFVMRKVVASVTALVVEVRADPGHPLRVHLDEYATNLIERLRTSPELAGRADRLKRDLLARRELVDLGNKAWNDLREFLVSGARSEQSEVRRHLEARQPGGQRGRRARSPK